MGKVIVIVGGQFGSEAKGHVAAYLGNREKELFAIRVGGPNAGHSVIDADGRKWAFRQLPVAAVKVGGAMLGIAAGSEIDPDVLQAEVNALVEAGYDPPELSIDPECTVILPQHKQMEAAMSMNERIGSTAKGIGAARADRVMRVAPRWVDLMEESQTPLAFEERLGIDVKARWWLDRGGTVLVEGTQGYGLGMHAGFYPHCTAGDCRAIDCLAQVGLSPWDPCIDEVEVWVVFRTYPIRVAGNSGLLKDELTWEQMGEITGGYVTEPELTTVTQKPRRIGKWDAELANAALDANGRLNVHAALMFADYMDPSLAGHSMTVDDDPDDWKMATLLGQGPWLTELEESIKTRFELIGTGPNSMIDRRESRVEPTLRSIG